MRKTKTLFCVLMTVLLLAGCAAGEKDLTAEEEALRLRAEYLASPGWTGRAEVTADYGLRVYEFTLDFIWQRDGKTVITVAAPEELAGLTATIGAGESRLDYQGVSLGTGDLTGEGLTPLEFLPAVAAAIDGGYIAECVFEELDGREALRVLLRDPEGEPGSGLEQVLWFDRESMALVRCELSQDGALVLSGELTRFTLGERRNEDGTDTDLGGDQSG